MKEKEYKEIQRIEYERLRREEEEESNTLTGIRGGI